MPNEALREKQHREILETLEVADQICNDWEQTFLHSIKHWTENKQLTVKQAPIQERLYAKACALPEHGGEALQPRRKEKKAKPRRLSPEEVWDKAPTPQEGDEEILF